MGSLMSYYIPKFRTFLFELLSRRDLYTSGYDYIVPIESKGAMLLNAVLGKNDSDLKSRIFYSRAFDYFHPSESLNKSVLLLDDLVISGGTMEDYYASLKDKGVGKIVKVAFLRNPKWEKYEKEIRERLKDVISQFEISGDKFHAFASEMTELYIKERPSYPDHFKVSMEIDKPIEPETLDDLGLLVRYDRSPVFNEWSLHYPKMILDNGSLNLKEYDSAFKIRLRNNIMNPLKWKIAPVVFPSLKEKPQPEKLDSLEKDLLNILYKEWHDDDIRNLDIYESITLADRIKSICGLFNFLESEGISIKKIGFDFENLNKYYGQDASEEIRQIANEYIYQRKNINIEFSKTEYEFDLFKILKLRIPILHLLDEKYRNHPENIGKPPWERISVGLTIKEIASELNESMATTSVAGESVNDYGYIVPMKKDYRRKYRDSEIGKDLLIYECA